MIMAMWKKMPTSMKQHKRAYLMRYGTAVFVLSAVILLSAKTAQSGDDAASLDALMERLQALEQEIAELKEQNRGLEHMLRDMDDDDIYIVVDTENHRLTLRRGEKVLRTVVVGTGSRQMVEEDTGRTWYFETPMGSFTVLAKERNPVWIRPDWSYVEENMPIPPKDDPDRIVRGVLGKYALVLGGGYKIHGTLYKNLLGTSFTHGCVSMDDEDLDAVYKAAKVGTKVYIY